MLTVLLEFQALFDRFLIFSRLIGDALALRAFELCECILGHNGLK